MSYLLGLILGAVQGLSEFLPVSSSGHLILISSLVKQVNHPLLFDVLLRFATLLVVLVFYRKIILKLIKTMARFLLRKQLNDDKSLMKININLIKSTLVTFVVALIIKRLNFVIITPNLVAICMLFTAVILILPSLLLPVKKLEDMSSKHSILIGFAQGIGSLTGISRSGITIATANICMIDRELSVTYSFLISIFIVIGNLIFSLVYYFENSNNFTLEIGPTIVGFIGAMIFGFMALKLLIWLVKNDKLWYFSIYLVIASMLTFIFL